MRVFGIVLLIVPFIFSSSAFGEATATEKLSKNLLGSWLVSVAYEGRTRLLKITEVSQGSGENFSLSAVYGWSDGNQTPVKAEVTQTAKERKLTIITQADTNILVSQDSDTSWMGTFTPKNGGAKGVRISRLSDTQLQTLQVDASKAIAIEKPAPDVPASCAAFGGHWTAKWSLGGYEAWLWVAKIDTKCSIRYAYLDHARPPKSLATAEIKDGTLSFICNRSTGGTCIFERKGDELWVSYSNPAGGTNSAVFKKVQ